MERSSHGNRRRLFIMLVLLLVVLSIHGGVDFKAVPIDSLFPEPLADPRYPRFSLSFPLFITQAIDTNEDSTYGGMREFMEFGGAKSLFRVSPEGNGSMGIELSIGAGIFTQFDGFSNWLANFGWEGSGFVVVNIRPLSTLSFRFGFHHLSSHVGDEYLTDYHVLIFPIDSYEDIANGTTYGMEYVRDSLMFGISREIGSHVRIYGELRYSMRMFTYMYCYNQFPWQANLGIELIGDWYAALDVGMYQESSWYPSITVQTGRILRKGPTSERFRFGIEYYRGRPLLAVFNHTNEGTAWNDVPLEQHIALGFWYDL